MRAPLHGPRIRRALAVLAAFAVVAVACGDDTSAPTADDGGAADAASGSGTAATTTTAEATTSTAPAVPVEPAVRTLSFDTPDAPGPAELDRVTVVAHGSEDAENVLVLVPGTSGGATYFSALATDVVAALPDWQVWSVDRRENLLEDHSMLDRYKAGTATNDDVFAYYLEWLTDPEITERFEPPADDDVAFARDWGMSVAVDDLAVVIDEAASLGGDVVLGGHSLGGTIAVAYATWDFDGRPGADDLSGLVLIDGGSSSDATTSSEEVEASLAELATGSPWLDLIGLGLPWAAGVFNALGSSAARFDPDEPSVAYEWPVLPESLKPPVHPTNKAQYGYGLDAQTSPDNLALAHMSLGHLAEEGEPRGWIEDEIVPVERGATMFSGIEGIDGTVWFHPGRLSIDGSTVNGGIANPAQEIVGVRAIHGDELALPIFALETGFGAGRVLDAARSLAENAGIADEDVTLVAAPELTHIDPLAAVPEENPLFAELVPFLERAATATG